MQAKFVYESILDLLKPKSEKEIEDAIKNLHPDELLKIGLNTNLPDFVDKAIEKGALNLLYDEWTLSRLYSHKNLFKPKSEKEIDDLINNLDPRVMLKLAINHSCFKHLINKAIEKGGFNLLNQDESFDIFNRLSYIDIKNLNPQKLLIYAVIKDDLWLFKKAIDDGAKISTRIFKEIRIDISNYLKRNKHIIKNIAENEKVIKIIEKVLNLDTVASKSEYRKFPKGFKQYYALKYVNEHKVKTRTEIIKVIFEMGYGKNTFNPQKNASWWSTSYYVMIGQYLNKDQNNNFILNNIGKEKLRVLHKKFKDLNIKV